ncbi:hypothetical protein [Glycomyces tritici]|uniref:DUF3995 domain-containing protein n=1 Tax=Glycomyces tritici TaxID=2665176 RepID=A0ABT7YI05_9ACTN|nr:hypothetical protein [Glycomyces tritici]MDN3238255.1 hypothetical protein [Glycomyces tritici]
MTTKRLLQVAAAWNTGYALIHIYWAAAGAPRFTSFGESFVPGRWTPVAIAAAAVLACLPLTRPRIAIVLGWAAGAAMTGYSFMFALDLVSALFGEFTAANWPGFLIRGAGVAGGVLTMRCAAAIQRREQHACPQCARRHGRSPERRTDPSPWWAYAAAYLALAGASSRFIAELAGGLPWSPTDPAALVFLVMYGLAGALLPPALAHRWGRIWPRWVVPLAGRDVPRWLVLVPAFMVGGGLTGYFGLVGTTYTARGDFSPEYPLWWTLVVIPGYTLWGVGILIAAASYLRLTRPECTLVASGQA